MMSQPAEIVDLSASQLARLIATRELSASEVCDAHIARCEQTHESLNALVWTRFDAARAEAAVVDDRFARGQTLGPLAGVPITVKECFYLQGSPACLGLSQHKNNLASETGIPVQRLQAAGGIVLGKTNVPQLMIWHECENPVYGRTNNPWNSRRTPGGSTGGEGAIVAAGGSALGLGNDLGGSIRVPAAWCGIHGLKPTAKRLTNAGSFNTFDWLQAMPSVNGPLAREVADLDLALRVLIGDDEPQWNDYRQVDVSRLRVGTWSDDGNLPPSPAVRRALAEATSTLQAGGATICPVEMQPGPEILSLYSGILQSDGGAELRRVARGSRLDWRASRILAVGGLGKLSRAILVGLLHLAGQTQIARLISYGGQRSPALHAELMQDHARLKQQVDDLFDRLQLDALVCPVHALPAPRHGQPIDLVPAASYTFLANLLGWPAGTVSTTTVREDEQTGRNSSFDLVHRQAAAVDRGSAGLPVDVQVIARPWREDIVLAIMAAIEQAQPRPRIPAAQLRAIGVKS